MAVRSCRHAAPMPQYTMTIKCVSVFVAGSSVYVYICTTVCPWSAHRQAPPQMT